MPQLYDDPTKEPVTEAKLIVVEHGDWMFAGKVSVYWIELAGGYIHAIPPQYQGHASSLQHRGKDWNEIVHSIVGLKAKWREVTPKLRRGEHHPQIWRNGIADEFCEPSTRSHVRGDDLSAARTRCVAFHRLQRQLVEVFEVVSPVPKNATAYGVAIQQTLALAAREIEALFRATYSSNHASPQDSTMAKWFQLRDPMRLDEWTVRLRHFPEWGAISPFRHWNANAAPAWWTANNKLKHDETRADEANLSSAVNAAAAVRILLQASFGPGIEALLPDAGLGQFDVTHEPSWAPEELYFAPRRGEALVSVPALVA